MRVRITTLEYPDGDDWAEVYRRALVTEGKDRCQEPPLEWKKAILKARHSPIRYLRFSFLLENIPSWVSVHLVRHVHAQPYVRSQRNDRQDEYDRTKAPQDAPVTMIWDMSAEELMVVANKRLCGKASFKTRMVVFEICRQVIKLCPEFDGLLVPMCEYTGECKEMRPCGRNGGCE